MIHRAPIVMFRNALRIALALFVLGISCSTPAWAQAGSFVCHDDTGRLDCADLEQAAEPLRAKGARVAVYLAEQGDENGDDMVRRLAADGLATGSLVDPALVAVYVSLNPRYAELRAGDTWLAALPAVLAWIFSSQIAAVMMPASFISLTFSRVATQAGWLMVMFWPSVEK